jgi:hypothetical protein
VQCIDDAVINLFQVSAVYSNVHPVLGGLLLTLSNLIVDCLFIAMLGFWYRRNSNLDYILSIGLMSLLKISVNVIIN